MTLPIAWPPTCWRTLQEIRAELSKYPVKTRVMQAARNRPAEFGASGPPSGAGARWLLENHRALIDAEFAINEGGAGTMRNGKPVSANIQLAEKVYRTFRFEVKDPGGHSASPRRDNAIFVCHALTGDAHVAGLHDQAALPAPSAGPVPWADRSVPPPVRLR